MDGEDPHTVSLFTLDGFATDTLIPRREEGVDISGIVTHITGKLIIESKHVGTLFVESLQFEYSMQTLRQFVERHREQHLPLG